MKKTTKILLIALAVMMLTLVMSIFIFADEAVSEQETSSLAGLGTEESPYLISSLEDLKWFRDDVNGGNSYDNKYVKLTASIDLKNELWTPIAAYGKVDKFSGIFDGANFTISNLKVEGTARLGLFGTLGGDTAAIKNLKIDGASIVGTKQAGAIAGEVASFAAIENCSVSNVTVKITPALLENGSYDDGNQAGGVVGHVISGTMKNCSASDVTIYAYRSAGGVVGCLQGQSNATYPTKWNAYALNCTANGVSIYIDQTIGFYEVKNSLAGGVIGEYRGDAANIVEENCIASDVAVTRKVVAVTEADLTAKLAEVEGGDTIVLYADVALTETLTISADKEIILDLNGKTISMEDASSKGAYAISNEGSLTIKDSSENEAGKITFVSTTPSTNYSYSTSTICNRGSLVVESGTIENTTNSATGYAIDTGWYTEDVSITINGGTVTAVRVAVRQIPYSATANNVLNITGGTISVDSATGMAVQTHHTATTPNLAQVKISGGELSALYAYTTYYHGATAHQYTDIEITGGTFDGWIYIYNGTAGSSDTEFANVTISGGVCTGACIYTTNSNNDYVAVPSSIKGGTFLEYVEEESCASGFVLTKNEDGTYGVALTTLDKIFTFVGYSIREDGTGITAGFKVDQEALAVYEKEMDVTIEYGSYFTAYDMSNSAIKDSLTEHRTNTYNLIINGVTADTYNDLALIMTMYVTDGKTTQYVSALSGLGAAENVTTTTYDAVKEASQK